jgi:hypothetical protein
VNLYLLGFLGALYETCGCGHHQLDSSPLFLPANRNRHITLAAYCLPYTKLPKNAQPEHIYPEDDNCNLYRNCESLSTFDAALPEKPKMYIELQQRKPKDKNEHTAVP